MLLMKMMVDSVAVLRLARVLQLPSTAQKQAAASIHTAVILEGRQGD